MIRRGERCKNEQRLFEGCEGLGVGCSEASVEERGEVEERLRRGEERGRGTRERES